MLEKQFFFPSPVEVVKVTLENIQEVADWCEGRVAQTESRNPQRKEKGILDSYVWVPTPEGSKMGMAFPGMYITKRVVVTTQGTLKITWAVFARRYFEANYFETPAAAIDATWAKKNPKADRPSAGVPRENHITINVNSAEEAKKLISQGILRAEHEARSEMGRDAAL